jgi:signal transduction histidine kinase
MRRSLAVALRRLSDSLFEVPDLADLSRLVMQSLPALLGVGEVAVLVWNRRLDAFVGLTAGKTKLQAVESQPEGSVPEARYLLSEGVLLDTGSGKGEGTLVPLTARSGMIGMLVLGARRRQRRPPFSPRQVELLTRFAARVATSVENHLYQQELIESERIAALGTMASMLAHDFRGPMTVIRGYAETFLEEDLERAEIRSRAELIVRAIDRLDRMATETLDYARGGGQLARRTVDIGATLELIVRTVEREFAGLEVVRDFAPTAGVNAALDVDKLQRVVENMAANASDAMGGHGRFFVSGRVEQVALLPPGSPSPHLVLTLSDEGPGVPAEIRASLFEPFVTAGKRRGTGLGLAVARRFVEDHDGTVTLLAPESSGPRGARFRIALPLAAPAA